MAKFRITERAIAYKNYEIEADNFEEAEAKWQKQTEDCQNAIHNAKWTIDEDVIELDVISNLDTHEHLLY